MGVWRVAWYWRSCDPRANPDHIYCAAFLGKTLNVHSSLLYLEYKWVLVNCLLAAGFLLSSTLRQVLSHHENKRVVWRWPSREEGEKRAVWPSKKEGTTRFKCSCLRGSLLTVFLAASVNILKNMRTTSVCFSSRACRAHFSSQFLFDVSVSPHNPRWISRKKQTASSLWIKREFWQSTGGAGGLPWHGLASHPRGVTIYLTASRCRKKSFNSCKQKRQWPRSLLWYSELDYLKHLITFTL